jgi:hypothetical protein
MYYIFTGSTGNAFMFLKNTYPKVIESTSDISEALQIHNFNEAIDLCKKEHVVHKFFYNEQPPIVRPIGIAVVDGSIDSEDFRGYTGNITRRTIQDAGSNFQQFIKYAIYE